MGDVYYTLLITCKLYISNISSFYTFYYKKLLIITKYLFYQFIILFIVLSRLFHMESSEISLLMD
jgi:hypothetical protein